MLTSHCIERQKQRKEGAVALFLLTGAETQRTTVSLDDVGTHPKTEAAPKHALGGVERFEDFVLIRTGHSFSGIGNRDEQASALRAPTR
jgi:hypothetical protein